MCVCDIIEIAIDLELTDGMSYVCSEDRSLLWVIRIDRGLTKTPYEKV